MTNKIWAMLCDMKFKTFILSSLVDKFQKWERNVNIVLAVTSSSSIAAQAIWNVYPFLWSGIIAGSQVLTVVKPYIPYFKYVTELNAKLARMENVNIEIEKLWYKLQNGKLSSDATAEAYFDLKTQITDILNFGNDTIFTTDKRIIDKANVKMKIFLKKDYNTEITISK